MSQDQLVLEAVRISPKPTVTAMKSFIGHVITFETQVQELNDA